MSALFRLSNRVLLERYRLLNQAIAVSRNIKTSTKKEEIVALPRPPVTKEDFANPDPRNWVSYGFSHDDEKEDRDEMKMTFFMGVTLCLVFGTFIWSYVPDKQMRDWAQREAYLQIRRREKLCLEHIDPNYVDPKLIKLPKDDELADTEIII